MRKWPRTSRPVIGVFGDKDEMSFAYTIGNHVRGLPEMLIVAPMRHEDMMSLLNYAAATLATKGPHQVADGELVDIGGTFPMKARPVGSFVRQKYTIQAGQYWRNERYDVIQLLLCDKEGRYPDDPDCDARYAEQPVLPQE